MGSLGRQWFGVVIRGSLVNRETRRVGADAERQRDHDNGGKAGVLGELTNSESKIDVHRCQVLGVRLKVCATPIRTPNHESRVATLLARHHRVDFRRAAFCSASSPAWQILKSGIWFSSHDVVHHLLLVAAAGMLRRGKRDPQL